MMTENPATGYAADLREARDKFNAAARELAKRGCEVYLKVDTHTPAGYPVERVQLTLQVLQRI